MGLVAGRLYYLLSVALLNLKGLLVVCNAKDVCQSLQGQELGLFRRFTHCRSPLCYILQIQFILENSRVNGAKKTSDNLKLIYLYEKAIVECVEERTPKVIPHFSSNGFN
ncbi:unnamed protein product [Bubo scandiacus]